MNINKKIATVITCSFLILILLFISLYQNVHILSKQTKTLDSNYLSNNTILGSNIEIPEHDNYSCEFILDNIIAVNQFPKYPTGCESVALYILLKYYNVDVSIDEIIDALPKGTKPYIENGILYGANPEKEFVGNPLDSSSYGCYNGPIAKTANIFKEGAISEEQVPLDKLKNIIYSGNPVIVWVNIDMKFKKLSYSGPWYDYETKEEIYWIMGEHAVVVYGYDINNIYISNPYNGRKYAIDIKTFEYNFSSFNRRVVYYE